MDKKIAKNSIIYVVTDLLIKISSFLLIPFYTKYIQPDDLGKVYTLIAFGGVLSSLCSLSLRSSISRFYYEEKDRIETLFSTIVNFTIVLQVVFLGIFYLGRNLLEIKLKLNFFPDIFLIILSSYLVIFYNYIYTLMLIRGEAKKISFISIISSVCNIVLTLVLISYLNNKRLAYLLTIFINGVSQFIIFIVSSRKYYILKKLDKSLLLKSLNYSIRILPFDLSGWILTFSDRFFLVEYIGFKATAIYSIGYKIGQAIDLLIMAINKSYVSYVYKVLHDKDEELNNNLSKLITNIVAIELFLTISLISFFKSTIFILGDEYSKAFIVVLIVGISMLFNGFRLLVQPTIDYNINLLKGKLIIWGVTSGLNIFLNVLLIPQYSYIGASLATLISYIVMFVLMYLYSMKNYKIKYEWNKLIKITLVSIFCFSLSIFVNNGFYLDLLVKIVIYLGLLIYIIKVLEIKKFKINKF